MLLYRYFLCYCRERNCVGFKVTAILVIIQRWFCCTIAIVFPILILLPVCQVIVVRRRGVVVQPRDVEHLAVDCPVNGLQPGLVHIGQGQTLLVLLVVVGIAAAAAPVDQPLGRRVDQDPHVHRGRLKQRNTQG